jgi:hypothetical protein
VEINNGKQAGRKIVEYADWISFAWLAFDKEGCKESSKALLCRTI